MNIVGLNAYHGDVAAVLVRDGELVAAVEEERFRRIKHWAGCPRDSVRAVLEMGGIRADEVDYFAVSRDPRAYLARNNRGILATIRRDGRPQLSPIMYAMDEEGCVNISVTQDRAKVANLRRDPRVSLQVLGGEGI